MLSRLKNYIRTVLDKIFLRRRIWETSENIKMIMIRVELIEKKVEYLIQKHDIDGNIAQRSREDISKSLKEIETSLSDNFEKFKESIQSADDKLDKNTRALKEEIRLAEFVNYRQLEARSALVELLQLKRPLPLTRGWAASPDFLLYIHRYITERRPKIVVELGSGVSTVVAAAALKANGDGHLHSLDHDKAFASATRHMLIQQELTETATVHHAPLAPWKPPRENEFGKEWQWYSIPDQVAALERIDFLIIDGPPRTSGKYARYPAIPQFRGQMRRGTTILLDDARRPDERAEAEAWRTQWNLQLTEHLQFYGDFEKGAAILTVPADE